MTGVRVAAGIAACITALLLQATLIGPLSFPLAASVPAVLVAAVAVYAGPAAGMTFGFAAGLIADLGSGHPLGVLALVWLALGLGAGMIGGLIRTPSPVRSAPVRPERWRSVPVDREAPWWRVALAVAVLAGLATLAGAIVLALVGAAPGPFGATLAWTVPSIAVDAVLAAAVVPLVRGALRSPALHVASAART